MSCRSALPAASVVTSAHADTSGTVTGSLNVMSMAVAPSKEAPVTAGAAPSSAVSMSERTGAAPLRRSPGPAS